MGCRSVVTAGGILVHPWVGTPVNPGKQLHMGLWLMALHSAFSPHWSLHGLTHFWFSQALSCGQSELISHSGLQLGGDPL
jgi:hypothetical protein